MSDIDVATGRKALVETYSALLLSGKTPRAAIHAMENQGIRVSRSTIDRYRIAYETKGFDGLLPQHHKSGRPRSKTALNKEEKAAVKANYLITNRTKDGGSVQEAVRMAARKGQLRPEIAEQVMENDRTGRMITPAEAADVTVPPVVVRQHRNPTEANLDYLNSPGSLMWIDCPISGEKKFVRVGDVLEADDSTVNFYVCVPWEMGGCPTSERFGVKIARFQWLVCIDRASRFVAGWSYTMRPKSSYRGEDVVSLFQTVFRQHGIWKRLCLERGVWESTLVEKMIRNLHCERMTAYTPHQKPYIESLFNLMWTKLSELPGQVGRFAGDEEAVEKLATSCRRGATDPRQHFPMLATVLAALDRVVAERNEQPIKSQMYGDWVPQERWLTQLTESREVGRLRPLPEQMAWAFSPCVRKWTVRGNLVGGSIQIMEGTSIRFDFSAPWLTQFDGHEVDVYCDPTGTRNTATIVLRQDVRDHRKDEVLGEAVQVNLTANLVRRTLGWGDDPDHGQRARKAAATAMRREVRAVLPGREKGLQVSEVNNGDGRSLTIERNGGQATGTPEIVTPVPRTPRRTMLDPITHEEFERQAARLAKLADAAPLVMDEQ